MQWPPTLQSHGSFLKENNRFFVTHQTSRIATVLPEVRVEPPASGAQEAAGGDLGAALAFRIVTQGPILRNSVSVEIFLTNYFL
jgi:hypothetical protein